MKKYNVILADPPWSFRAWSNKGMGRSAEQHYPTMRLEDINALPVSNLAAGDCVLFLWATFPMLKEALSVIDTWGFAYKTMAFTWVRGNPKRQFAAVHQVILSPVEQHSKKPDEVRERIVALMGDVPRVELFARQETPGWDVWGNEVSSCPDVAEGLSR